MSSLAPGDTGSCLDRRAQRGAAPAAWFCLSDPFYWINPGVLVLMAVLPVLLLQTTLGLVYLCLQRRLRGTAGRRGAAGDPSWSSAGLLELQ